MRYIIKTAQPHSFTEWKNENAHLSPTWMTFQNPQKDAVKASLLNEQFYICCYCGKGLQMSSTIIEHLIARETCKSTEKKHLILDYDNFLASCDGSQSHKRRSQQERSNKKQIQLHCDAIRGNQSLEVHPLMSDCEDQFTYATNGAMNGVNCKSRTTIIILELDCVHIQRKREAILAGIIATIGQFMETNKALNKIEKIEKFSLFVNRLYQRYAIPETTDNTKKLRPYCFVICFYLIQSYPMINFSLNLKAE